MFIAFARGVSSASLPLPLLAFGQTKDAQQPDASAPSATGFENGRLKAAATEATSASHSGADQSQAAQNFRAFLDADWTRWMEEHPEHATQVGYPGQDERWTDGSHA